MRGRQIAIELVFDRTAAAWARDRIWHPSQELAPLRDGKLRMTLRVADTRELVGWILSFGRWSTLARRKKVGRLRPDESDRVYRLARIAAMAADVLEGKEHAARWLGESNRALGGEVPLLPTSCA